MSSVNRASRSRDIDFQVEYEKVAKSFEVRPAPRFYSADRRRADQAIAFLDLANSMEAIRGLKRRSYEMLSLRPGMRMVDVGCGTGYDAFELARRVGTAGSVFGVDVSKSMIEEACRRLASSELPVAFACADARSLPFRDASFDCGRVERLLHLLDKPGEVVSELTRTVVPGGTVVVSEPDWRTLEIRGGDERLTARVLGEKVGPGAPAAVGKRLPELFAAAGLTVRDSEPVVFRLCHFESALTLFSLLSTASRAIIAGRVSNNEVKDWLRMLQVAARHNDFECSLAGCIVSGTK